MLREAVADAARLEAHFIEHVGHRAEVRGRSRDVITSFWIDVATFSVGQAPSVVSIDVPMVSDALGPAANVAKRLLADHEATAARDAAGNAEAARRATRPRVVPRAVPRRRDHAGPARGRASTAGQLVSWEQFQQLPDRVRLIVRSQMEETTGRHGVNLDGGALRDVIKVEQLPIYQELD